MLVVSVYWGLALGLATSLASAAAFNFFHIPPIGRFTISDSRNWVALAAFILVAAVVSAMADLARSRTLEAERRRVEADLAAGLARELLAGDDTRGALRSTARRVSKALGVPSAAIELGEVQRPGRLSAAPAKRRRRPAGHACSCPPISQQRLSSISVPMWFPRWKPWWPSPCTATPYRPRRWKQPRCAGATS